MGDVGGSAPSARSQYAGMAKSYVDWLPSIVQTTAGQQPAIDRVMAGSAAYLTPEYSKIGLENLMNYGVPYAQVGQDINRVNALGQAGTDLAVLQGPGRQLATTAKEISQTVDPEYYKTRETASNRLGDLMNSIDLNRLSGSERAEVERSLNTSLTATGNLGLDNATNAVQNAMQFGSALQTKRDALGRAIQTATNFLPAANSKFDAVQTALGRPSTSNPGTAQFQGVQQAGSQAFGVGSGAMSQAGNIYNTQQGLQWEANKRSSPMGVMDSITAGVGNVCCFIMLEGLNGQLPWWVRHCRDIYYSQYPEVADGYKRMAKWLVPLMRRFPLVKHAVNRWMVQPLTRYGGYLCKVPGYEQCKSDRIYKTIWFSVWRKLANSTVSCDKSQLQK